MGTVALTCAAVDEVTTLAQILTTTNRMVGLRLHGETLPAPDSVRLAQQSKHSLVIIASSLADHLEYTSDGLGDGRALILVQGSEMAISATAPGEFRRPCHVNRDDEWALPLDLIND